LQPVKTPQKLNGNGRATKALSMLKVTRVLSVVAIQ
jgi:hypothetical protein